MTRKKATLVWLFAALFILGMGAAVWVPCVWAVNIPPNITYAICDTAQLTKVSFFMKDYKGAPRLHMEIGVKNVSSEVKRFRVNIFLPQGPGSGGLYPRKLKGDVKGLEAGKAHTRVFPMYFDTLPSGFTIVIKEVG